MNNTLRITLTNLTVFHNVLIFEISHHGIEPAAI